jgi:hypothetical protein
MKTQTYKIILRLHKFTQFDDEYLGIKFEEKSIFDDATFSSV